MHLSNFSEQQQTEIQHLNHLLSKKHIQEYIVKQNFINSSLINQMRKVADVSKPQTQNNEKNQTPEIQPQHMSKPIQKKKKQPKQSKKVQIQSFNEQIEVPSSAQALPTPETSENKNSQKKTKKPEVAKKQIIIISPSNTDDENLNFSIDLNQDEEEVGQFKNKQQSGKEIKIQSKKEPSIPKELQPQIPMEPLKQEIKVVKAQKKIQKNTIQENNTAIVDNNYVSQSSSHFFAESVIQKQINCYLQTLIAENIPHPTILERFEIQQRNDYTKIVLNRSNEWMLMLESEVNKLENPKRFTEVREDSQLLLEMAELIYDQRQNLDTKIYSSCSHQRFKIKLIKIKKTFEKGIEVKGINTEKLCNYLQSFEDLVANMVPPKARRQLQLNRSHLETKIIDMFCANIFFKALDDQIVLPQILKILYFQNCSQIQNCIRVMPDISFLEELIEKTGYYHLIEEYDYNNLNKKSFVQLRNMVSEMKCNDKFEISCYKICRQVLTNAASKIKFIDQTELRNILNHSSVQLLKTKLNNFYPTVISMHYKNTQTLPVFLGCIIQFFEYYLEQKEAVSQNNEQRSIRIGKDLINSEFIITHQGEQLTVVQQKQCRTLFKQFLNEVTSRNIMFPQCLAMFKIKKRKLALFGNNMKLIGIMLVNKFILPYFITCLKMEHPLVEKINQTKYQITSVPLLDLELNKTKINLEEIFIQQVNFFYDNYFNFENILLMLFNDQDLCNLIECESDEIQNAKIKESFEKLKDLKDKLVVMSGFQTICN